MAVAVSSVVGYLLLIAITVAAAANPRLALPAGLLYSVLMGLWVGAISRVYEAYYDGIVAQALLASLATVLACLVLYLSRAFRLTAKRVRVIVVATLGVGLLYFLGWIFSIFGLDLLFFTDPGNPVGIAISVAICIVAALNLMLDFGFIEVQLEQRVGRLLIRGFGGMDFVCDGQTKAWSAVVIGDNGLFKGGKAASLTFATACDLFTCGFDEEAVTIQLKR